MTPSTGAIASDGVFGPQTCVRGTGGPTVFSYGFAAPDPSRGYILKVHNGGLENNSYELVSSSTVTLNGVQILGPDNFNQDVASLELPVTLQAQNALGVEVRGKPGGAMVIEVLPLVVIHSPTEGQVLGSGPITVSGRLLSSVSSVAVNGIAAAVAGGTFSAPAVRMVEGANVITAAATRGDGFRGTDSVHVVLDSSPPTIAIDVPSEGLVTGRELVPVYSVADVLDPNPAVSVSPPPPYAAEGAYQMTVTATDWAGNQAQATRSFTIDQTAPVISALSPAPGSATANAREPVSATFIDALSGIDAATVRLVLDGGDVTPQASVTAQGVEFVPAAALSDGSHHLALTVRDRAGNEAVADWSFRIAATPPAMTFSASLTSIVPGQTAVLSWSAPGASSCSLSPGTGGVGTPGIANLAPFGSLPVTPRQTTTFTMTATGPAGTATAQTAVTVVPPPTLTARASPEVIVRGEASILSWNSTDATSASLLPGIGAVPVNGDMAVSPAETTTYIVSCEGLAGSAETRVTVSVLQPPTVSLSASPETVVRGESVTLSWSATDATSVTIDQGIGEVGAAGSLVVTPTDTTTYHVTAVGTGGAATGAVTVTVNSPGIEAGISASPATMVRGESAILAWTSYAAHEVVIEPDVGLVGPSGSIAVSPSASTTYRLTAVGPSGVATSSVRISVEGSPAPIPQGQFGAHYQDLVPADATIAAYDVRRFSLVTGRVFDQGGSALAGVRISAKDRAELGTATSGADGRYTLPVEGGGAVVLDLVGGGFLPAQRLVNVGWNDIAAVEPVVLLAEDPLSTTIAPDGNPASVFVHRGSVTRDGFGSRAATLAFSGDTRVYAVTEAGDVELSSFDLRATEYATAEAMPAVLPPESIYTYCVDLRASGLERVRFSKPAALFVENFFGVPVGTIVPVGYYDFKLGRWVASQDGTCVALLDTNGDGTTDALDAGGDGLPDDLDGDGSYADEVAGLADPDHYPPGSTFWRASITHLTPYDLNFAWVWVLPASAAAPNGGGPPGGDGPRGGGPGPDVGTGDPPECTGSFAASQGRIFHEDLPVPGAGFGLHYSSDRVPGYRATITVPASGSTVPSSLEGIEVRVTVAGRAFERTLPPLPDQVVSFDWDGLDHLGRAVTAPTTAKVDVGFVYRAYLANAAASSSPAFGRTGGTALFSAARMNGTLWTTSTIDVHRNLPASDLGQGWDLSIHHTMSPANPTVLFKGDGSILRQDLRPLMRYAGGTPTVYVDSSCNPAGMAVDGAGNVFVSDTCVHRVLKIDRLGAVTTYAGRQEDRFYGGGFAGDGGPATDARLKKPTALAVDPSGNLYIFDSGNLRIRKVDTAGTITTVVGNGQSGSSPDATVAATAYMTGIAWAKRIAVDNLGNVYYFDSTRGVRKIGADGLLTTVLGASSPDVYDVLAVDRAGNLYAGFNPSDANARAVVRRLSPDGRVTTVAGGGTVSTDRDGIPALQARFWAFYDLAVDRDGSLYLTTSSNSSDYDVFRVDPAGFLRAVPKPWKTQAVAFDPEGAMYALSSSGHVYKHTVPPANQTFGDTGDFLFTEDGLGYLFSAEGRHKATVDLVTRANLHVFGYDGDLLTSVTDRFGKTTTIQRDGFGHPVAIVLPDGRRTDLLVSGGRLERATYPDGTGHAFRYDSAGLLREKWNPRGSHFAYQYDAAGRLQSAQDPEGGQADWLRWTDPAGKTYTQIARGEGTVTSFQETTGWDGSYTSTMSGADGSVRTIARSADRSTETITGGCGLTQTRSYGLDPAWNYQYLRELTAKTPSGLTRKGTVTRTYQDTNVDLKPDRVTTSITVNNRATTLVDDTLGGTGTSTSPAGRTATIRYDPVTLLPVQASTAGLLPASFLHDARGNLVESTVGTRTTRLSYDSRDLLDHVTTPEGRTYDYSFDDMGRLRAEVRPDGSTIEYRYDANGNMTALVNPHFVSYAFDYTANDQRKDFVQPFSGTRTYWYDRERRLERIVAPSGSEIVNTYAEGNLATTTTPEGTTTYDFLCGRRLETVSRGGEGISFTYDGPLVLSDTRSGTVPATISYAYGNDFMPTSISYAGAAVSLGYDSDGLLTSAGGFAISRDARNGLPLRLSGRGLVTDRTFNGYGELDGAASTVGPSRVYAWSAPLRDNAGRILERQETIGGNTIGWDYAYDAGGRLLEVRKDDEIVESYSYDANGNRLNEANSLRAVTGRTYQYSVEDHVVTAGADSYRFDVDGFLQSATTADGTTSYEYSSRGELLRVDQPDGTILTYVHDPLGRRVAKQVNGTTVETYLWKDRTTLLAVNDGNGNLLQRFAYADGRTPVAMTSGGAEYFLLTDQVGSLRAVADASGNVVKRVDYDSFGTIIADSNPTFTVPLGFAGGLHDRDTGLVRFGYRDYSPELGRFTAKDPIDFAGSDTNLYAYVMNDPVNLVDPLGLYDEDPHQSVTTEAGNQLHLPGNVVEAIALMDRLTDKDFTPYDCRKNSGYHFSSREQAWSMVLAAKNLKQCGRAMHALQDSFSHEGMTCGADSLSKHVGNVDKYLPGKRERDRRMYEATVEALRQYFILHPLP